MRVLVSVAVLSVASAVFGALMVGRVEEIGRSTSGGLGAEATPAVGSATHPRPVPIVRSPLGEQKAVAPVLVFVCSGSALGGGIVLTAAHCLDGGAVYAGYGGSNICVAANWTSTELTVVSIDTETDVALLRSQDHPVAVGFPDSVIDLAPPAAEPSPSVESQSVETSPSLESASVELSESWNSSGSSEPSQVMLSATGWQQPSRTTPLHCEAQTVTLSGCRRSGPQLECSIPQGSRICSGLSGAPVVDAERGVVAVVSSSLGCETGPAWIGLLDPDRTAHRTPLPCSAFGRRSVLFGPPSPVGDVPAGFGLPACVGSTDAG